jgi:hypothetical protein
MGAAARDSKFRRQLGFYGRGARVGEYPVDPGERLALAESARTKLRRMIEAMAAKEEGD